MPDFFIVGQEKCGTTALYTMLREHPQVFMPDFKEPRFFCPDARADDRTRPRPSGRGTRPRTLEAYLDLFTPARPEQRVGEASPQYLRSLVAAELIAELQPGAKIIAILREPVSAMRSLHMQNVRNRYESERDLRAAMALEDVRRNGELVPRELESPIRLLYSEHVSYLKHLRRYEAAFPRSQILVLIFDDFRRDNEATVRSVWRFLEVDDALPVRPANGRQPRKVVRSMPLHRLTRAVKLAQARPGAASSLARTLFALTPRPARELWRRAVYAQPASPDRGAQRRSAPPTQARSDRAQRAPGA